jgi:hypothetical protein
MGGMDIEIIWVKPGIMVANIIEEEINRRERRIERVLEIIKRASINYQD